MLLINNTQVTVNAHSAHIKIPRIFLFRNLSVEKQSSLVLQGLLDLYILHFKMFCVLHKSMYV